MPGKKVKKIEVGTKPVSEKKQIMGVDAIKIREGLDKYSRAPFQDFLRQALTNAPDDQSIQDMAQSDPLRWATYTEKVAGLYGYTAQSNVNHTHRVIHEMSTVEIEAELKVLEQKAIDVEFKQLHTDSA